MRSVVVRSAAQAAAFSVALAFGAAGAAPAATPPSVANDMPMADYLGLLAQIAPAAEEGARAYLQAHQHRCGRQLATADLRRAMSDGDGDPTLMAMIRASHLRDSATQAQLGQRIACKRRASR
ncbi:MAG: hypothetical protein IH627_02490 [Rubrivivax sp.]|nr:hypothetical protein [Rubrivivax sp.]